MIATIRLAIEVLDANDNSPEFSQHLYTFALPEDITADTVIGVVKVSLPFDTRLFGLNALGVLYFLLFCFLNDLTEHRWLI